MKLLFRCACVVFLLFLSSCAQAQSQSPFFQPPTVLGGHMAEVTADFNRDGKPDLLLLASPVLTVLLGNGDGTFQAPVSTVVGRAPYSWGT
jgi:hypothetical protein